MIHNNKLNRKINFLLEADQAVPPNGIDPRMFEYPVSPKPTPATYTNQDPIGGNQFEDDEGIPFDMQEFIDNHPGFSPDVYKRFSDWVKSLTWGDLGQFGWDLIEPWPVFLWNFWQQTMPDLWRDGFPRIPRTGDVYYV